MTALKAIKVRAISLANNHSLDYEEEALIDTRRLLADSGLVPAGEGQGVGAAAPPRRG